MSISPNDVFYCAAAISSFLTLIVNVFTIMRTLLDKKGSRIQYRMLLFQILFHTIFNISCVMAFVFKSTAREGYGYAMCILLASSTTIIVGNICIVIDRLMAIHNPVAYVMTYKNYSLISSICFLLTVFGLCVVVYTFQLILKYTVDFVTTIYYTKSAACAVSVIITVAFLWKMRIFLRTMQNADENTDLKKSCQIVVYQIIAEIVIIIIPAVVTTVLNSVLTTPMSGVAGFYPTALFAVYTTVCSLCLAVKMRKANVIIRHLSKAIPIPFSTLYT